MGISTITNSFISGELSPSVIGRTEKAQYHTGASTMRNCFVRYTGGASSRAGLAFVGMCKQGAPNVGGTPTNNPPRDIPFQFSINQGFVLEFGDQYMRIKSQGAYITEAGKNITLITQANPAILQIIGHGYSVGDWIFIQNVVGMTNFNNLVFVVNNIIDVNNINVTNLFGSPINSTTFSAYISGGTSSRIYTVVAPYAAVDLPYLKFTQSANVMTFCCVNQQTLTEYNIYDLQRFGNTNWQFGAVSFQSDIGPPTNVTAVANNSTTKNTNYGYVVTAVDASGFQESVASSVVAVENNDISINAGSNVISWNAVPGASRYKVYETTPSYIPGNVSDPSLPFGYIGTTVGTNFTDTNITPDFTTTPPMHNNPFAVSGITGGIVQNPGSGYTAANIGYTINTVTGSGAVLQLSVNAAGQLSGIKAIAQGQNYNPLADTITITSGGVTPPTQATGSYTFITNPTVGQNIVLNGHIIAFQNLPTQPGIGGTLAITLQNMLNWIATAGIAALNVASYSVSGSVLNITYKTTGVIGNSYTIAAGSYGGVISGNTLTGGSDGGGGGGSGATAILTFNPASGNTPSVVSYYQQRRVYANTTNQPNTYFFSKPGAFENLDSAIPTIDSDAIIGSPWAQQINGIQFFQPTINGLLTFTGNGVWIVSGGNSLAITPADQNAQAQGQVGCSATVPPLYVNLHGLYVQSKNSIVRDVAYNFLYNVFFGTDITVWSSHLFQNYSILQWAYAEESFKIIWVVRNDGTALSLTYVQEEEVKGWARHDTNGLFQSVCTITEKHIADINNPSQFGPLTDATYFIVKRYITGQNTWVYYAERMDDRNWFNVEDVVAVDACLTYPMTFPQAVLSPAAANGTNNITSTLVINGGNYPAHDAVAAAVDSTGVGTGATFTVSYTGNAISAVTPVANGQNYTVGQTTINITSASGGSGGIVQPVITNYVTFNASSSVFTPAMIGSVIRADNGKATIISQTGTACIANITQPLTVTIPNDPNNLPEPVAAGEWSVSAPVTIITGLNHLQGMTVTGLADGGVIPPTVIGPVTGGIGIVLAQPASSIVIGLPYTCQLQTTRLDVPSQQGTTQGKRGNISNVVVRVENSRGVECGANQPDQSMQPNQATLPWLNMKEIKERNNSIQAGASIPLFSGDTSPQYITAAVSDWSQLKQVAFQQQTPLPMNILACISEVTVATH